MLHLLKYSFKLCSRMLLSYKFQDLLELIPRAIGNGYWNMYFLIFVTKGLTVVCLWSIHSPITVNKQKVTISIIFRIMTVLFVLLWRGWKYKGSRYLFYFSVIWCSLEFWFKDSMFESDCRQTILFAKKHILQKHVCFVEVYQLLIQNIT
jgi:hypothetical protein